MSQRFMKRLLALLLVPLVVTGCASRPPNDSNGEVTLTLASSFARNHSNNEGLLMILDELEKRAPWIHIDYKGGPEVMAPNLLIEGVSGGVFDLGMLPGDYYVDQVPALDLARFTPFTPAEERENGVADIYDEIHREQLGVTYLGRAVSGMPMAVLSRNEISSLNLHGKSLRTSAATSDMVSQLHGVPVDIPGNEVYTALERNVVSGATWASVGPSSLGLQDVVSYDMAPRFYESLANLVMNEKTWDALDERTRNALSDTVADMEMPVFNHYLSRTIEETGQWHEAGVRESRLNDDDAAELIRMAYKDAWGELDWDRILETSPAAAKLRDAYDVPLENGGFDRVPGGAYMADTERLLKEDAS